MPTTPGSSTRRVASAATAPRAAATPVPPTLAPAPQAAAGPVHRGAPAVPAPQLLTASEVAARLRVDVRTVRRYIGDGQLPAYRVGRTFRVHPQDLQRYLSGRRSA